MPDIVNGSDYSTGWRPIHRSDENHENHEKIKSELDSKIKVLTEKIEKMNGEYPEKVNAVAKAAAVMREQLNSRISELQNIIDKKDEEIGKLSSENARINEINKMLEDKCRGLMEQLLDENSKDEGILEPIIKKFANKNSHQNEHMHSMD
ncbi:hypothetical protein OXPF_28680 [Oxobacter pfennigii]|uniref:Uncharacterized protein n=1 Tax=Oxobacter pfennigii TaxID=36849 RepID=A0A0P8WLS9_9CLOT|nr:hypothetical protein [Oxobacter pfennigii]KPU43427.1 hypothetical protein OXPF_28680 [Oxobacter pfennigii]